LLRPELAEELGWLPQAIASYEECLRGDPESAGQAREFLDDARARRSPAPAPEAADAADPP
jgi:hypothetical protein